MKILIHTFLVLFLLNVNPEIIFSQESSTTIKEDGGYIILSTEKYTAIEAEMNKQDDWCPILIEGFPKNELVAFYIQSYTETTISTWVDWAYKKIHSFERTKPEPQQERKMQKALLSPRTKENMHHFMMLMTTEQIEVVGY